MLKRLGAIDRRKLAGYAVDAGALLVFLAILLYNWVGSAVARRGPFALQPLGAADRRRFVWLATGAAALLILLTIPLYGWLSAAVARRDASAASTVSAQTALQEGIDLKGAPAPAFALTDQTGAPVALAQLRGHPVVLTFFDSVCPHADCSLMAQYINWTARDLGARQSAQVEWVAISVDPWHDTPASATAFLTSRQVTLPLRYLLGTADQLAPVWTAYNIQAVEQQDGVVLHTTGVYVLDAQGRERLFLMEGFDPAALSAYLHALLAEPGTAPAAPTVARPAQPAGTVTQTQVVAGHMIGLTATPGQFGTYDFTVEVQDAQGVPVQGAAVDLTLTMPAMEMAPLPVHMPPLDPPVPGAYRAKGVLSMAGQWQVVVHVRPAGAAQPIIATFRFNAKY